MKDERTTWTNIAEGDRITVWRNPHGYSGQGGIVQSITAEAVTLLAGTSRFEVVMTAAEAHHVTKEVPFDADECLEYDPDTCGGEIDMFAPGNGRAFPRCRVHRDRRMESYDKSMERYADSDVEADWFDPANIGEHWGNDY